MKVNRALSFFNETKFPLNFDKCTPYKEELYITVIVFITLTDFEGFDYIIIVLKSRYQYPNLP